MIENGCVNTKCLSEAWQTGESIETSEKHNKVEKEKKEKGTSIRQKLAEKKAEIERKKKQKDCDDPKKSHDPARAPVPPPS